MAITPYSKPTESTFVETYQPLPMRQLGSAAQQVEQRHQTNMANADKLRTQLQNISTVPGYNEGREYIDQRAEEINSLIDQAVRDGDYSRAQGAIRRASREFQSDSRIQGLMSDAQQYQEYRKQLDELVMDPESNVDERQRDFLLNQVAGRYQGKGINTIAPIETMDLESMGTSLAEDIDYTEVTTEDEQGNTITQEERPWDKIYTSVRQGISQDKEANQTIAREWQMSGSDMSFEEYKASRVDNIAQVTANRFANRNTAQRRGSKGEDILGSSLASHGIVGIPAEQQPTFEEFREKAATSEAQLKDNWASMMRQGRYTFKDDAFNPTSKQEVEDPTVVDIESGEEIPLSQANADLYNQYQDYQEATERVGMIRDQAVREIEKDLGANVIVNKNNELVVEKEDGSRTLVPLGAMPTGTDEQITPGMPRTGEAPGRNVGQEDFGRMADMVSPGREGRELPRGAASEYEEFFDRKRKERGTGSGLTKEQENILSRYRSAMKKNIEQFNEAGQGERVYDLPVYNLPNVGEEGKRTDEWFQENYNTMNFRTLNTTDDGWISNELDAGSDVTGKIINDEYLEEGQSLEARSIGTGPNGNFLVASVVDEDGNIVPGKSLRTSGPAVDMMFGRKFGENPSGTISRIYHKLGRDVEGMDESISFDEEQLNNMGFNTFGGGSGSPIKSMEFKRQEVGTGGNYRIEVQFEGEDEPESFTYRNLETLSQDGLRRIFNRGEAIAVGNATGGAVDAIIGKESGGDRNARNRYTDAQGLGQIMPENIPQWTEDVLGKRVTDLSELSEEEERKVIEGKVNEFYLNNMERTNDPETALGATIAQWYGGPRAADAWINNNRSRLDAPQVESDGTSTTEYPTIREYVTDILNRLDPQKVNERQQQRAAD